MKFNPILNSQLFCHKKIIIINYFWHLVSLFYFYKFDTLFYKL